VAMYGTPTIDGIIDPIWERAGLIVPQIQSSERVQATGEFRVLWDDGALYTLFIVTDPVLNSSSMNSYEQDSVEVFLDEANDKGAFYQSDDVHYPVNCENIRTTDAGDPHRFFQYGGNCAHW